jgi:1-acyl-sn-glycerol-3-phosphate acyltransferase
MVNEWAFHIVRNVLRLPVGAMIRKVHFDGTENFTKGVPVMIASTHPNSFFDGVVFEHISRRRVYTLTRGDAFANPIANYMLRSMRILPIFRARDADSKIARSGNARTMDELYERFKLKHSILIFTEGVAYPEKGLRTLKRGTGSIAAEMAKRSNHEMDLHVVPTALNYTSFWPHMFKTVHVTYHTPIRIMEYKEMIENDERGFVSMVTDKVQDAFDESFVVTKGEFTEEKEFLHDLMVNENYESIPFKINNRWKLSIAKANAMNTDLASKVKAYTARLSKAEVLDSNVGNRGFDYPSTLVALITFGFSLPIFLVWSLLFKLNDRFVKRKYKNIVFRDAVKIGIGVGQVLLLMTGVVILTVLFLPHYWWIWVLIAIAFYGAICWFRVVEAAPHLWKELKWRGMDDSEQNEIREMRKEIVSALQ